MRFHLFTLLLTTLVAGCDPAKISPGYSVKERPSFTVSGNITYDRVPITSSGLDFEGTIQMPVRKVRVQAIDSQTEKIVSYTDTDLDGDYEISIPKDAGEVYLRVLAEVEEYQFAVVDNTSDGALYSLETDAQKISEDTSGVDIHIPSGWSGTNAGGSYTGERAAAPFAIVDTLLTCYETFKAARPDLEFPALRVNWSVNNTTTRGNKPIGDIGTSHYVGGELFILGKDGVDTDEYDTHVMVHEWGHYFEDQLGRSENPGGAHSTGDIKTPSLAFGEGWGNALSAIVMYPNIDYRDSKGPKSAVVSPDYSLESDSDPTPGWFSEASVQEIIYDIFDSNNETGDTISLGLGPIIDIMTDYQTQTRALTSIFSFIKGLKVAYPAQVNALNTLTSSKSISPVQDDFGTGETNNGGWSFNLPVYNTVMVDGAMSTVTLWGRALGLVRIHNDMSNNRFFKFTATSTSTKVIWVSEDTYLLEVYDGGNKIMDVSEDMTGTPLSVQSQVINTVPGQIYSARVYTIGPYVYGNSEFNFLFQLQSQ